MLVVETNARIRREHFIKGKTTLDLPLLPARSWRAGDRVEQIVAAHLQEAATVETPFTDEDRLDGGLHVS